jgi:ABC-type transport system involved in cytochrome bd biosynthesis fused ATPase/permease subunit
LLANFDVLILDEPTEHLDDATAAELTADLLAATHGRTTLLITHRTDGLAGADEVMYLGLRGVGPDLFPNVFAAPARDHAAAR